MCTCLRSANVCNPLCVIYPCLSMWIHVSSMKVSNSTIACFNLNLCRMFDLWMMLMLLMLLLSNLLPAPPLPPFCQLCLNISRRQRQPSSVTGTVTLRMNRSVSQPQLCVRLCVNLPRTERTRNFDKVSEVTTASAALYIYFHILVKYFDSAKHVDQMW